MEEWRNVVGFEEYFEISNFGNVKSKRTGKVLVQGTLKSGYKVISTKIGGRKGIAYCLRVHRLVADAFLPKPSPELVSICESQGHGKVLVRHKDNNKENNLASNLEWGTYKDNYSDFMKTENFPESRKKVAKLLAKLTEEQVEAIIARYVPFCRYDGCRAIARDYGVHHEIISRVVNGKYTNYADVAQ